MQSTASTISRSLLLLKFPRQCNFGFRHGFIPMRFSCSSSNQNKLKNSVNESGSSFWLARSWSLSSLSFPSSKVNPWTRASLLASDSRKSATEVRAASTPESAGEDASAGGLNKSLGLGMMMRLWYPFNTYFNMHIKKVSYMILQRASPVTHSPVSPPIDSSAGQVEDLEIYEKDLESEDSLLDLYERWRTCYGVTRTQEEMSERFKVFKQNVEYIYRANQMGRSYELGLNPFTDMTTEEFARSHACLKISEDMIDSIR